MSGANSFSNEQTATVQSWADQGDSLSDIQKKLASELDVKVTYMELRFLLDDLGVKLKEVEKPEPEEGDDDEDAEASELSEDSSLSGNDAKISISALQRPGALISGTATFVGGEVEWWLDQMGQLGMNSKDEEFRPNQEQMASFQKELQKAVQEQGF